MLVYKNFKDITKESLELRREVFIMEQKVPLELELEADEDKHIHCCLYENDILIAYARVFLSNPTIISRVCVKKEYRNLGYGKKIMGYAEAQIPMRKVEIQLHAQLHAATFYESLGYTSYGRSFSEANIEHINMKKNKV
ncbi:MAG: GNAT family N-acetyltransferase [Acholeplasmatales bacterium]|jgi:predicted GNAT family N-acyltransferase|nr:GNAT family N-acetyltransferase [Acholeplasmatales bacterium]